MNDRRKPSKEDADLWRHVTESVTPLRRREKPPPDSAPEPPAKSNAKQPAGASRPRAPALKPKPKPAAPPLSHGAAPGVDKRTADNLRRGRMSIEARIDLHGLTQAEAHRALTAFVDGQQSAGRRCVLVVTGKGAWREGGGVLREAVPRWLNEPALRQKVLSFSYAQPKDGGEGALYILLRRLR